MMELQRAGNLSQRAPQRQPERTCRLRVGTLAPGSRSSTQTRTKSSENRSIRLRKFGTHLETLPA
jgi:hypothetical protein